jgi:hypothetical protein
MQPTDGSLYRLPLHPPNGIPAGIAGRSETIRTLTSHAFSYRLPYEGESDLNQFFSYPHRRFGGQPVLFYSQLLLGNPILSYSAYP